MRLGEHQELRTALGLERVPDYTTLYRFLRRVDTAVVRHALTAAVACLPLPTPEGMVVAVDATGFSPTAASRSLVDLTRNRGPERTRQHWPRWVVAVDVLRRVVLGQLASAGPANASSMLRLVVDLVRQAGAIGLVVADAGSTASAITATSATTWAPTAASPPSGASPPGNSTACGHRCGRASPPTATASARWSRASSPPPSARAPHGLQVVCPSPSTSRRCSSAGL